MAQKENISKENELSEAQEAVAMERANEKIKAKKSKNSSGEHYGFCNYRWWILLVGKGLFPYRRQ